MGIEERRARWSVTIAEGRIVWTYNFPRVFSKIANVKYSATSRRSRRGWVAVKTQGCEGSVKGIGECCHKHTSCYFCSGKFCAHRMIFAICDRFLMPRRIRVLSFVVTTSLHHLISREKAMNFGSTSTRDLTIKGAERIIIR